MRLTFPRAPRVPGWPRWAIATVAAWLALVGVLHLLAPQLVVCSLRRLTGLPCPGCGLTRGVTSILRGDLAGGLAYNPALLAALLVFLGLLGVRLLLARAPRLELAPRERRAAWALGGGLVLANWAYVIACAG